MKRYLPAATIVAALLAASSARAQFGSSGGSIGGNSMGSSGGSFGSGGPSGSGGSTGSGGSFDLGSFTLNSGLSSSSTTSRTSATSNRIGGTTLLGSSYSNPLLPGMGMTLTGNAGPLISFPNTGNTSRTAAFGQPLYQISGTTGTASATRGGTVGSALGQRGTATTTRGTTSTYVSSVGMVKSAGYVTEPRFRAPIIPPAQIYSDVVAVLSNSSRLDPASRVEVLVEGPVVVLRGTVLDEEERQLAADTIRLTPGVREVRNELTVRKP